MPEPILFPSVPPAQWEAERDSVWFPAQRGERKFACRATLELLMERFGVRKPGETEALRAYEINHARLQQIARAMILAGKVTATNDVILTAEDFGLKEVIFSAGVRESLYYHRLARQVTGVLEEVLGPSAGITTAEWDRTEDAAGRPLYLLEVRDAVARVSVAFTPQQLESVGDLRGRLYRLWGDLLQARNHKQLEAMVGAGQSED